MRDAPFDIDTAPAVNVALGEHAVGSDERLILTTVLGSCVAVCLRDSGRRMGGMNHFMLPGTEGGEGARYGLHAMELLINALLRAGARRSALRAKLFGGARMRAGLGDIGAANAAFARDFLAHEGIECVTESLGGDRARRLRFHPAGGRVRLRLLDRAAASVERPAPREDRGDVTFF